VWNSQEPWKKAKDMKLLRKIKSGKRLTKSQLKKVKLRGGFLRGALRQRNRIRDQILSSGKSQVSEEKSSEIKDGELDAPLLNF